MHGADAMGAVALAWPVAFGELTIAIWSSPNRSAHMGFVVARASGPDGAQRWPLLACFGVLTLLSACGQDNRFVAPPPPKVTVQLPLQQEVTPYLEATGNTAAVNLVKLVARVQG